MLPASTLLTLSLLLLGSVSRGNAAAMDRSSPGLRCSADDPDSCRDSHHDAAPTLLLDARSRPAEGNDLETREAPAHPQEPVGDSETSLKNDEALIYDSLDNDSEALREDGQSKEALEQEEDLPVVAEAEVNYETTDDNALLRRSGPRGTPGQRENQPQTHHTLPSGATHNITEDEANPPMNVTHVVAVGAAAENPVKVTETGNSADHDIRNSTSPASVASNMTTDRNGRRMEVLGDPSTQSVSQVEESHEREPDSQEDDTVGVYQLDPLKGTPVRKCCEVNEFFSLQTQNCEEVEGDPGFTEKVRGILAENSGRDLQYVTGRLQACPGTGDVPIISEADFDSHSLLPLGHLREHLSGVNYDHEHYCLELAAAEASQLTSALMVTAFCPRPVELLTRKCCELDQYFNHKTGNCMPKIANMSNHEDLVYEFLKGNPMVTSIHVNARRLMCDRGAPRIVIADEAFLDASNELCERQTGHCYPASHYCIEYLWAEGDTTMTAVASVCPRDFFQKCCLNDHVLTESGCAKASHGAVSARMMQLLEVMDPQFGFPIGSGGEQCVQEWITPDDLEVRWWISKSGYLSIDTKLDSYSTVQYCVDDYLDPTNKTQTVALMCYTELEDIVPVHLSTKPSEAGSVGKCCPHNQYMSMDDHSCVSDDLDLTLLHHPLLQAANITKLTYTSFPHCKSGREYHYYYLDPDSLEDHAILGENQVIEVVSLEGKCVLSKQPFQRDNYCLEYGVDGEDIRPLVLVCPDTWEGVDVHSEKFGLTAVLLGMSCTALLATAFSLVSTRVRRGLVTVKKVNTLAGRILLSYVMAYLVGFLLLAVNMKVEVTQDNTECHVMAGLLIFFLLAAFQWNTSICLESLLLTLRVSTSECRRYVYHSLWAWGVPGFITALALTLDHHRHSLPCGVITPKVGLYKCFFSDRDAMMVYLYVPMLASLCANIALLAAARYIRSAKLRRLEHGPARAPRSGGNATEMQRCDQGSSRKNPNDSHQAANAQQSGLRTHQTRNLWTESVKLVVWSGATWLMEVIGFVVTRYIVTPSESWYDYLWYMPSSVNALRGVGIFFILVLTPENRVKMVRAIGNLGSKSGISFLSRNSRSVDGCSSVRNPRSSMSAGSGTEVRDPGRRKVSNATTITQLSSIRSSLSTDSRPDTGNARATTHPRVAHSISQVDTRRSSESSASSDLEGLELDAEVGAGGRRKVSLANFGIVSLPSVDEEEVFDEATPRPHAPLNTTKSVSDA